MTGRPEKGLETGSEDVEASQQVCTAEVSSRACSTSDCKRRDAKHLRPIYGPIQALSTRSRKLQIFPDVQAGILA